jgi:outer membrane protein assembly factor BamD
MGSTKTGSFLSLCAIFALCACAAERDNLDITKPITGDAATNAEKAYKLGLEEKNTKTYLEATRYFQWVKNNFPYSQYAALSELALADMAFDRDDFTSAATNYADFVKGHPSHPKAAYAAFRVGVAHFNDKPSEWVLLPPAHEKDQGPLRQALDALQKFALSYPSSEYIPEAKRLINECRDRLAAHERYVADFYFKRSAWKGAASRYLVLADQYGDLDGGKQRGEALWRAGLAYQNLGDGLHEKEVLTRLVQEAPGDPHRREADQRLSQLAAAPHAPTPAPTPTPTPAKESATAPAKESATAPAKDPAPAR